MNIDRITAMGHQLRGAAKSGAGKLLGDAKLIADGAAEQAAGQVQSAEAPPIGMDPDRIGGLGHQLSGALKQEFGKLVGDANLIADGAAERAAGQVQSAEAPPIGMDPDRIGGIGHQLRGALKQEFGKLVGDTVIEADGIAERASGKLQNQAGSARDELRHAGKTPDEQPKP